MLKVLQQPDPRLRVKADTVVSFDQALAAFCDELYALMGDGPGAVGIAATQVGIARRVVVVDCSRAMRRCKHHGLLYLVNPVIASAEGERLGREGCLSVPDWVGTVPRAAAIELHYDDIHGQPQVLMAKGFEARVIQHEIDHLDGLLFTDRVVSTRDLVRRIAAES